MSLQDIAIRATNLQEKIQSILGRPESQDYPQLSSLRDQMNKVSQIIEDTKSPARIGLVGGFSSGKTRALESLLGIAGQLHVTEKPATGNIVVFHLIRDEKIDETSLENWRVRFMSEADANDVLTKLLENTRIEANNDGVIEVRELIPRIDEVRNPSFRTRWEKSCEIANKAHGETHSEKMKAVCFEINRLVKIYAEGGRFLGNEYSLKPEQAQKLTALDYDPTTIGKSLETLVFSQKKLPEGTDLASFSDEDLSKLFPLVQKISVDVRTPPLVFDRFKAGGALKYEFVDCPGFGAATSSIRDQTLCNIVMKDIDSILIFLNSRTPGSSMDFVDIAANIWGKTVRNRLLVAISRFDEIPLKDGDKQKRKELYGNDSVSEQTVLDELNDSFATLLKYAKNTVYDERLERICLFSAMAYIDLMKERNIPLGTSTFFEKSISPEESRCWRAECREWGQLGKQLKAKGDHDKEANSFADMLESFGQDGGGGRLVSMLCDHLEQHGNENIEERLHRDLALYEKTFPESESDFQEWLKEQGQELSVSTIADGPEERSPLTLLQVRDTVKDMLRCFNRYKNAVYDSRFSVPIVFRRKGSVDLIEILPALRRATIEAICSWPEWDVLIRNAKYNPREGTVVVELVDEETAQTRKIPMTSDHFLESFLKVIKDIQYHLREDSGQIVHTCIENLNTMIDKINPGKKHAETFWKQALEHPNVRNVLNPVFSRKWLDEPSQDTLALLFDGVGKDLKFDPVSDNESFLQFYPLQRKTDFGGNPRTFPWKKSLHEEFSDQFNPKDRHLMTVIQMRQVLIDAALYFLDVVQGELERSIRESVKNHFGKIIDALDDVYETLSQQVKEDAGGFTSLY